jgi:peptidyl-prolyl cis-trans isomerase A (cyclophilin A)
VLLLSLYSYAEEPSLVELETNIGVISIELYPKQAPVSVNNFLAYVEQGFYSGTIFHRTIPGFMIQGGGFNEQLERKPTHPPVKNESMQTPANSRGTIAFARTSVPDSATSQFFINVADNMNLNYQPGRPGYAVFGKVVAGMDIVDQIAQAPTQRRNYFANLPVQTVVIKSARTVPPAAQ